MQIIPKEKNMYKLSVKQWNPYAGCRHGCVYCKTSFQRQLKRWAKKNCPDCFEFKPHPHPERLKQPLPRTQEGQFIFTLSSGDVAFCPTAYLKRIAARIEHEPHKTFLIQTKNPETLNRITWSDNVILGVTLETNRDDTYEGIAPNAPKPSQRYTDFLEVQHPHKMVTIEPIIDFDPGVMLKWMMNINPCVIWIGYDSGKSRLPEPKKDKVDSFISEMESKGLAVLKKKMRKAWNE